MSYLKKLLLLLVATLALRCLAAASLPLLAGEAYYWLWGQYPAAGYFDHPPLVGLMSRIFFGWVYGSELAARSGAIVLGLLTIAALYGFVRELFCDERLAWHSAALFSVTPIFVGIGACILPDNGLLLFMVLAWWFFWRASEEGDNVWWAAAGAAAGLALLSKFHAWVLLPPLWIFLLLSPRRRKLLATPGPWIAALVALIVLSPNLVWNAQHDWINYAFQWRRSGVPKSHFELTNVGIFLIGALLSIAPLLLVAMVGAVGRALGRWRDRDDRALYLLCAGLPLPAFLGALSLVTRISFHWPSCGYVPLLVLTLYYVERGELPGPLSARRFVRAMWGVSIAMAALMYAAPFALRALPPRPESPTQPYGFVSLGRLQMKMTGWRETGARVRALQASLAAGGPTIVVAKNWHVASMLAFYTGLPRQCFALEPGSAHNFDLWRREREDLQEAAAIAVFDQDNPNVEPASRRRKYKGPLRALSRNFRKTKPLPSLVFYPDGTHEEYMGARIERPRLREFLLVRCYGFHEAEAVAESR